MHPTLTCSSKSFFVIECFQIYSPYYNNLWSRYIPADVLKGKMSIGREVNVKARRARTQGTATSHLPRV